MNEIFIEKYYPSGEKPNTKDYVKLIKFIWKSKKGKSVITESRLAVSWVVGGGGGGRLATKWNKETFRMKKLDVFPDYCNGCLCTITKTQETTC